MKGKCIMVQTIQQSKSGKGNSSKGNTVPSNVPVTEVKNETVPTVTETTNVPSNETNETNTNGDNNVTTATVEAKVPATEKVKKIPLSQYKEEVEGGFNMSEYLRSLIEKDNGITTEDALIQLELDHPRLVVKKEAFGVVLSNLKSKEKNKNNPDSPSGKKKGSSEVSLEDVIKAKELVKNNGGLDTLLAALESYRAFKTLTDALGGEEKTVKILEMMDALRKE